jgi:hypothetical protein
MLISAAPLQKGDVAVAFSYSGQTLVVVEAVRQARKNGAHTIAVTNHADSLSAKAADLVLCARVENAPLSGERGRRAPGTMCRNRGHQCDMQCRGIQLVHRPIDSGVVGPIRPPETTIAESPEDGISQCER